MIDPNISKSELSDELLIQEFIKPTTYKIRHLYGIMAKRSNDNEEIKKMLFELILSEDARSEKEMGFIMHAWLPAIAILKEANNEIKIELREVLKKWTKEEKEIFLNYIKSDPEYYKILHGIVD